jgi:hypothetical protein
MKFLSGERCKSNGANQIIGSIAQYPEKINHIAINVIVGFHRRGVTIQKHGSRAGIRLAVGMGIGEQGKKPI